MSRYTELEVNQQATRDAVREDGVLVTLHRKGNPVADGAGGFTTSDEYVPMPAVRRWFHGVTLNVRSGNTRQFFQDDQGQRLQVKYVLVGPPGDDVHEGDVFDWNGQTMQVVDVHPDVSFETRAQVLGWSDGDGADPLR